MAGEQSGGRQSLCGLQASRTHTGQEGGACGTLYGEREYPGRKGWDGGVRRSPGRRGTGKGRAEPTARGILRSPSRERGKGPDDGGSRRHGGKGQVTGISKGESRDCALGLDLACVCGRISKLPETTLVKVATNLSVGFKWPLGPSCHSAFSLCFAFLTSCALLLW